MSAAGAATALAARVKPHEEVSGPENGAQRCIRKPGSVWTLCTCPPCRRRKERTRKLHAAGLLKVPDVDAAAIRLQGWVEQGWEASAIASATGLTREAMWQVMYRHKNGSPLAYSTARRILTATPPTSGWIEAAGVRRRLQALAWMGWRLADVHAGTGVSVMSLSRVRSGDSQHMTAANVSSVADFYRRMQDMPGPSRTTAQSARQNGWAPPAAWDDDSIDYLDARPQGVGPAGPVKTDPQVLEQIAELHRVGRTDREIADRLGYRTPDAVGAVRRRHLKGAAA